MIGLWENLPVAPESLADAREFSRAARSAMAVGSTTALCSFMYKGPWTAPPNHPSNRYARRVSRHGQNVSLVVFLGFCSVNFEFDVKQGQQLLQKKMSWAKGHSKYSRLYRRSVVSCTVCLCVIFFGFSRPAATSLSLCIKRRCTNGTKLWRE